MDDEKKKEDQNPPVPSAPAPWKVEEDEKKPPFPDRQPTRWGFFMEQ